MVMKRISYLLAAAVCMMFAVNLGYAQHGGGMDDHGGHGDHGRDSTVKHQFDSIINHHRGALDSLIKHHGDDDSLHGEDTLHGRDTIGHHDNDDSTHKGDTIGHGHGRDTIEHRHGNRHQAVDARFVLSHDSCRFDLESKMTAADAQQLEDLITRIKTDRNEFDTLRKQLRAAFKAGDTTLAQSLRTQIRTTFVDLRSADSALRALLANYQDALVATMKDCAGRPHNVNISINARPVAPNPIRTGSTTLTFDISANAAVDINLFSAVGTQIQNVLNSEVTAGTHSVQVNLNGLQPGPYYLRIQAGNAVTTQKLMIVR